MMSFPYFEENLGFGSNFLFLVGTSTWKTKKSLGFFGFVKNKKTRKLEENKKHVEKTNKNIEENRGFGSIVFWFSSSIFCF